MMTQDRFQLASVSESELPQQSTNSRGCVHIAEECFHAAGTHQVEVIDAVRAHAHAGDERGQLR